MDKFISVIVLFLYPFLTVRRYHEYKYTRPVEARKIIQIGGAGLICFLLVCIAFFKLSLGLFQFALVFFASCSYFLLMSAYVKINFLLRDETPA